jgi:hypothetical protein
MYDATPTAGPPSEGPAVVSPVIVRTRKVAILGFGATAKDCPWKDPSW